MSNCPQSEETHMFLRRSLSLWKCQQWIGLSKSIPYTWIATDLLAAMLLLGGMPTLHTPAAIQSSKMVEHKRTQNNQCCGQTLGTALSFIQQLFSSLPLCWLLLLLPIGTWSNFPVTHTPSLHCG
jgi:hypothetical protein